MQQHCSNRQGTAAALRPTGTASPNRSCAARCGPAGRMGRAQALSLLPCCPSTTFFTRCFSCVLCPARVSIPNKEPHSSCAVEVSHCPTLRAQRVRPASAGLPLLRPGTGPAPARNRTRHIRFPGRPGSEEGERRGRWTREHGEWGDPLCLSPLQGGMSAAKPKRIKFSDEEKFLILEEFSLRKDILIPKSGRYRNTQDRQRAWEEIAAAVNALSPVVRRTAEEIRKKWHNMVLDARRELAADKHPLLRQRPQERLFHHIFALFNKPGPPPAPSFGLPAAAPELLPHGPAPDRFPGSEERRLPGTESRLQPNPGPAAPRAAPPQGAALGPPPGNPEPPRVKCPLSPALAWPCLEAMASPASLGTGSPGPPEPPHDNGGTVASEELSEKQRQLHTEILELQKETLQLQKEKIVLEKEKLLLEILKLRRELGT
ncbi:uncharacterized protein [Excalfactoria chinensis]|uniref:uncharacterized protein n=1 Tax=Excalfactoria chinensis TaxID=46218 RepID=UPI003B3B93F9